jgi:hypothetical protein
MKLTPHALTCRMLRNAGKLDFANLPFPRRSESVIDWLVRARIAESSGSAGRGLLIAAGLAELHAELCAELCADLFVLPTESAPEGQDLLGYEPRNSHPKGKL